MENFKERSCRLCLNSINDTNSKVIDDTSIQFLSVLLKRDLDIDKEDYCMMCNICSEKLQAAFDFKSACLCIEDSLCPYIDLGLDTIDLKEIYMKVNGNSLSDDEKICRLCMMPSKKYTAILKLEGHMFEQYIPEVDLSITKDPVVCKFCLDNLVSHSSFINSFDVEGTLENIEEKVVDNNVYISHLNLDIKSEIQGANEETKIEIREMETFEHIENKNGDELFIKSEVIEVKSENECNDEESFQPQDVHASCHVNAVRGVITDKLSLKRLFKCDVCDYVSMYESHLREHMVIHKNTSEVQWYQCISCNYKSRKNEHLKLHELVHQNPSEIKTFKCNICGYKTIRNNNLKIHMLRHKEISEIDWHKCYKCDAKFQRKAHLTRHKLNHRVVSEIVWHKCDKCDSKFKKEHLLSRHKLIHLDASNGQWYQCDSCSYKTRRKDQLKYHQLIHRDPSKISGLSITFAIIKQ